MNKKMRKLTLLCASIVFFNSYFIHAQFSECSVDWNYVEYGECIGQSHVSLDINSDGIDEVIVSSTTNHSGNAQYYWYVISASDGYEPVEKIFASQLFKSRFTNFELYDVNEDGKQELIFASGNEIYIYDLTDFRLIEVRSLQAIMHDVGKLRILDIENDGDLEMVLSPARIDFDIKVYGWANLNLKYVDVLIHSGDSTNRKTLLLNETELNDFIDWYSRLPIDNKIYIPGNHDMFIEANQKLAKRIFKDAGITLLIKDSVEINGFNIYGDPTTPFFFNWAFNVKRDKIHKHWDLIPDDTDILVTHGPPKGILDLVDNHIGFEFTGCSNLYKQIKKRKNIKAHLFGHIHSDYYNIGVFDTGGVKFSNGSCVLDNRFREGSLYHGNLLKLQK